MERGTAFTQLPSEIYRKDFRRLFAFIERRRLIPVKSVPTYPP